MLTVMVKNLQLVLCQNLCMLTQLQWRIIRRVMLAKPGATLSAWRQIYWLHRLASVLKVFIVILLLKVHDLYGLNVLYHLKWLKRYSLLSRKIICRGCIF
mgnify:CR=1 FL=1